MPTGKQMDKCPACNARLKNDTICRRCKSDLSLLMGLQEEALSQKESALRAYERNEFTQMFTHARRSAAICSTPEALQLLACAAVLVNRHDLAYGLWKKMGHVSFID